MKVRRTTGVRAGGRSERVVKTVLAAALEELGERGAAGLTMDGVIQRSGVSRTTVYRRWPNKTALISALLTQMQDRLSDSPHAATLREDLVQLLLVLTGNLATAGQRQLAVSMQSEPEGFELIRERSREAGLRPLVAAFSRAQGRGEAGAEDDPELLSRVLFESVVARSLELQRALPVRELEPLIDVVLRSLRPVKRRR